MSSKYFNCICDFSVIQAINSSKLQQKKQKKGKKICSKKQRIVIPKTYGIRVYRIYCTNKKKIHERKFLDF